jgi:hypothetical protein
MAAPTSTSKWNTLGKTISVEDIEPRFPELVALYQSIIKVVALLSPFSLQFRVFVLFIHDRSKADVVLCAD